MPLSELFIHGEVEAWHVLMVSHDRTIEVSPERAQYEEKQPNGGILYARRTVGDHLSLEMDVILREPVRSYSLLQFSITEWDDEEYGGIAGELRYDKESGLQGNIHMSGSFPRDLYSLLLSGSRVAFGIETKEGFYRRSAWVTSLAFSDSLHPQWLDEMTVAEAEKYIEEGHFAPGSMLPKVQAIIKFLKEGGKKAHITDPPNIQRALNGETGTWIVP